MTASIQRYMGGLLLACLLLFGAIPIAHGQGVINSDSTGLTQAAQPVYGDEAPRSVPNIIGSFVNILLGLLGLLVFLYILWGGILWMTAGGNSDKVADAQKMITQAVIGALIILSSFAISTFIVNQLGNAITDDTNDAIPIEPPL